MLLFTTQKTNSHRSHFGSRYLIGSLRIAGLFFIFFWNTRYSLPHAPNHNLKHYSHRGHLAEGTFSLGTVTPAEGTFFPTPVVTFRGNFSDSVS